MADASRNWYIKLRGELIKLGAIPSKIDPGIFCWYHNDKLIGIMICFVDDILWGGITKFSDTVTKLKEIFCIGTENSSSFRYIGMELLQNDDFSITLSQDNYISNLNLIDIKNVNKGKSLDDEEKTKLREI